MSARNSVLDPRIVDFARVQAWNMEQIEARMVSADLSSPSPEQRRHARYRLAQNYLRGIPTTALPNLQHLPMDSQAMFAALSLAIGSSLTDHGIDHDKFNDITTQCGCDRADWMFWLCRWKVWEYENGQTE